MTIAEPWWKTGVIYQIYPISFQDSNGDGWGDLAGVTRRLEYLQRLGVAALWLTPVFTSPQADNGYDVADYYSIDPRYGSLADFDALVAAAHRLGIRVILDMVLNHSSTRHPWFVSSQDPASPFRGYYFWRDGRDGGPPNNWLSKFGGSAWHRPAPEGQYYLHLYSQEQADLNWDHPGLRAEMKKICHFWADRGVDGVRLDVINVIAKDTGFPNAADGDGRPFYTDLARVQDYLREMNREVFAPRGLMTLGEMSSTSLEKCLEYAALDGSQLSMAAHFHHLKVDYAGGDKWALKAPDYPLLKSIFNNWQRGMHGRAWNTLFWCNHDQPRIVSRFGDEGRYRVESAKMLAMVLHGMQGTPFIYQGEELGMINPGFGTIGQYRDVESLNQYAKGVADGEDPSRLLKVLAARSRDNGRTPMRWDGGRHAGFTTGTPWIEAGPQGRHIHAEAALADPASVFYCYQRLIALRQSLPVLTQGDYRDLAPDGSSLWHYLRVGGGQRLMVLANLTGRPLVWRPAESYEGHWRALLGNYADPPGAPGALLLRPYEAVYWLEEED